MRFYYVRGGTRVDTETRPFKGLADRMLRQVTRSGIAWVHRGLFLGVVRTGLDQYVNETTGRVRETERWVWRFWYPLKRLHEYKEFWVRVPDAALIGDLPTLIPNSVDSEIGNAINYFIKRGDVGVFDAEGVPWALQQINDASARDAAIRTFRESLHHP